MKKLAVHNALKMMLCDAFMGVVYIKLVTGILVACIFFFLAYQAAASVFGKVLAQ